VNRPRVYADTSVFGGCFDKEFSDPSLRFFSQVEEGRFRLVTSALVAQEIESAPANVQELSAIYLATAEVADITDEAILLRKAYIEAGILSERALADALHVAVATTTDCEMIVSWNFQHIVHFRKIPLYNAVNTLHGYGSIAIYSPLEVIEYEQEDS